MSVSFRKSIHLFGPIYMNISKRGISFSFRTKAGSITRGKDGTTISTGAAGVRYTKHIKKK